MRGTIKLDERTCSGCSGVAGGIELRSTAGDIDFGGRVTSKGVYHYIDPFIVDAAGQARVTASIRARERGDDTDGATIAVTGGRVSVEAPASFDVSGRFLGGTVRLRGRMAGFDRSARIRAQGRTVGGGGVYIDATAGAATVSGAVVVGGGRIDPDFPEDYVPGG